MHSRPICFKLLGYTKLKHRKYIAVFTDPHPPTQKSRFTDANILRADDKDC